jgi:acyl carrier protein
METLSRSILNEELRHLVTENLLFGQQDGRFSDDDSFMEKGIIDSTGVLELVRLLEQRYSILLDDDDLVPENLDSINNLSRFVEAKLRRTESEEQPTPGEGVCC